MPAGYLSQTMVVVVPVGLLFPDSAQFTFCVVVCGKISTFSCKWQCHIHQLAL